MGWFNWKVGMLSVALVASVAMLLGARFLRPPAPTTLPLHAVNTLLVRTDYSDTDTWITVRNLIRQPTAEGFAANVDIIEDQSWTGLAPADVIRRLYPDRSKTHALMILADAQTMRDPEHTLLCIDPQTLNSLRVIPSLLWSIENNLSLANLDWHDFAENTDKDGVLRGFKEELKKPLAVPGQP